MKSKSMQKHIFHRQNGYEEAVCNGRDPFLNCCVWVSVSQCFILWFFKIYSVLCSGTFHRPYLKHHNHKSYATRYPEAQSVIIQLLSLAKCCKGLNQPAEVRFSHLLQKSSSRKKLTELTCKSLKEKRSLGVLNVRTAYFSAHHSAESAVEFEDKWPTKLKYKCFGNWLCLKGGYFNLSCFLLYQTHYTIWSIVALFPN